MIYVTETDRKETRKELNDKRNEVVNRLLLQEGSTVKGVSTVDENNCMVAGEATYDDFMIVKSVLGLQSDYKTIVDLYALSYLWVEAHDFLYYGPRDKRKGYSELNISIVNEEIAKLNEDTKKEFDIILSHVKNSQSVQGYENCSIGGLNLEPLYDNSNPEADEEDIEMDAFDLYNEVEHRVNATFWHLLD